MHSAADEKDGRIVVSYEVTGEDWKLSVTDNGMGKPQTGPEVARVGLGTSIVNALAQQLDARVALVTGEGGTSVSITHIKTLVSMPRAA